MRFPRIALALAAALPTACEIEPNNPFDPESPRELQQEGTLVGRVVLAGRDLDSAPVTLRVREGAQLVEREGAPLEIETRGSDDGFPAGMVDDERGAAGTFSLSLAPGDYTLIFDAGENGAPGFFDEELAFSLAPGSLLQRELAPVARGVDDFEGAVIGSVEGALAGRAYVVRLLALGGEIAPRTLVQSGDGEFNFDALPTGVELVVRLEGDGYAPASSAPFTLTEANNAGAPFTLDPLRLVTLGELFVVDHDAMGASAPYVNDTQVPLALNGAQLLVSTGIDHVEFRGALSLATFDDDQGWQTDAPSVDLGARDDGEVSLEAQLRICFQADCDCGDAGCQLPLVSGAQTLEVVLDTAPPALLSFALEGETEGTFVANCARFSGCPASDPYAPLVELELDDGVGEVAAYGFTVNESPSDDAPSALTPVVAQRGLALVSDLGPALDAVDFNGVIALWALDAAGNLAKIAERDLVVDVTPPAVPTVTLTGTVELSVDGDLEEVLPQELLTIDVDPAPAAWSIARDGGPILLTAGDGEVPYTGPLTAFVPGAHRDLADLRVRVLDESGNASEAAKVVRVWRTGRVFGTVSAEGGNDPVGLSATFSDAQGTNVVADVPSAGQLEIRELLAGTYSVVISANGLVSETLTGVVITSAADTLLPPVELQLPRGSLSGQFALAGREGTTLNAGIQVSLLDNSGSLVAGAATLADGSYTFAGIPAATGYSVIGTFDGFLPGVQVGLSVVADQNTAVPSVVLQELEGDFRLCAPGDGTLDPACDPLEFTNLGTLEIGGISFAGFDEFRVSTSPFPDEDTGYQAVQTNAGGEFLAPSVDLSAGEGRYTVFLQLRSAGAAGDVLESDVVLDQTPPSGAQVTLQKGAAALLEGFTNAQTASATVNADPGVGDVAPLGDALVLFDTAAPGTPTGTRCPHGSACDVDVDAPSEERLHTVFAFSCDAADNCTAAAVSAAIIVDLTPPSPTHGAGFVPTGASVLDDGGEFFTRSAQYSVNVDLGAAETAGGQAVLDLEGQTVADVIGARFGIDDPPGAGNGSFDFTNAELELLSATGESDVSVSVAGPALPGIDGRSRIFAQFVDAAGNASADVNVPFIQDLTLDTVVPGISFSLDDNAAFSGDTIVTLSITEDPQDPPASIIISLDDGVFASTETRAFPLSDSDFDLGAVADGTQRVFIRAVDRAGNFSQHQDEIVLDQVAPQALLVACGTCTIESGLAYTNEPLRTIVLDTLADDETSGVGEIEVAGLLARESYAAQKTVTLPDADGQHDLDVRFFDRAGNQSAPVILPVVLDRVGPVLAVTVDDGSGASASADVSVAITGTDTSPLTGVRLSDTAVFTGDFQPFTSPILFRVADPEVDEDKDIFIQVQDAAGNITEEVVQVRLDTSAPTGSVSIAGGAERTNDDTPTVDLSFDADAVDHAISLAPLAADCSDASFTGAVPPAQTTVSFAATGGDPETREVFVCTRDDVGNVALTSDSITFDDTAPDGPSLVQPAAGELTKDNTPRLEVDTIADAANYEFTVFQGAATVLGPLVVSSPTAIAAPLPDGDYTWEARALDLAGNRSALAAEFPASFSVDATRPTAPGAMTVLGLDGSNATNDRTPSFTWTASTDNVSTDDNIEYTFEILEVGGSFPIFSAVLDSSGGAPLGFTVPFPLQDGDYGWQLIVRDEASNVRFNPGPGFSIDTEAPDSPSILPIASPASKTAVFNWTPSTGAAAYRLRIEQIGGSCAAGFTAIDEIENDLTEAVIFPDDPECNYLVRVNALDSLGNQSVAGFLNVTVDAVEPVVGATPITINPESSFAATSSEVVTLQLSAIGATKVRIVDYVSDCQAPVIPDQGDLDAEVPIAFSETLTYVLPPNTPRTNQEAAPPDRCKTIAVSFGDDANNFTAASVANSAQILLDDVIPDAPQLATESAIINDADDQLQVDLSVDALDHNLATYEISTGGNFVETAPLNAVCLTSGATCSFNVALAPNAENLIRVRARDDAGNVSADAAITIVEDDTAPAVPADFAVLARDQTVTATWTANSETDLGGYEVLYTLKTTPSCSTDPADYAGAFADQGASPIDVGGNESVALTGMPNGVPLCVAIRSYDQTTPPNLSALAGQEITPFEVTPTVEAEVDGATLGILAGNETRAVVVQDGVLYMIAQNTGLIEFDAGNDDCFQLTDAAAFSTCTHKQVSAATLVDPVDLEVQGNVAFVADSDGLKIFELSASAAPALLFTVTLNDPTTAAVEAPTAVAVSGPRLVVAHDEAWSVFDISPLFSATPAAPSLQSTTDEGVPVLGADLQGAVLVLARANASIGARTYDVQNLATPAGGQDISFGNAALDVEISGNRIFIYATNGRFGVFRFVEIESVQQIVSEGLIDLGSGGRLALAGPITVAASRDGVDVMSTSGEVRPLGSANPAPTTGSDASVAVSGHRVFYNNGNSARLFVMKLTQASALELLNVDGEELPSGANAAVLMDSLLVTDGVQVLEPDLLGHALVDELLALAPAGGREMVAERGLLISAQDGVRYARVPFSVAMDLENVSLFALTGTCRNVELMWPIAFVVCRDGNDTVLHSVDLSVDGAPALVESTTLGTQGGGNVQHEIARAGEFLYVGVGGANAESGIHRVEVDALSGEVVTTTLVQTQSNLEGVHRVGRHLWYWSNATLRTQDLSDPTTWDAGDIATIVLPFAPEFGLIEEQGDILLVPGGDQTGVFVLERSGTGQPTAANARAIVNTSSVRDATLMGDRVFMFSATGGTEVHRLR